MNLLNLFKRKPKPVRVMKNVRFVAAYSEHPFEEAKSEASYPDFRFHTINGMNWCVRVGSISVPWGFSASEAGYRANGVVIVRRRSVDAGPLDGKGFDYRRVGQINYLYENELVCTDGSNRSYVGFVPYMRSRILPAILRVARATEPQRLAEQIEKIKTDGELLAILDEHRLVIEQVSVRCAEYDDN